MNTARLLHASAQRLPDMPALARGVSIASRDYVKLFEAEPAGIADVAPGDVAWLFYTSGTTGVPKGAMLTHGNLLYATQAYFADIDRLGPRLYQLLGQGEAPMTITGLPQSDHAARHKLESCGYARTGVEVRVVDGEDRDLPKNKYGKVLKTVLRKLD